MINHIFNQQIVFKKNLDKIVGKLIYIVYKVYAF